MRDPRQRQILEGYFSNPKLSAAELEAFAGTFPDANFMISQNLLTQNRTPDQATLAARDAESWRVVRVWLADARFGPQRPALEKISRRLEEFTRQVNQGSEPDFPADSRRSLALVPARKMKFTVRVRSRT